MRKRADFSISNSKPRMTTERNAISDHQNSLLKGRKAPLAETEQFNPFQEFQQKISAFDTIPNENYFFN